jgi:flagellar protein FliL
LVLRFSCRLRAHFHASGAVMATTTRAQADAENAEAEGEEGEEGKKTGKSWIPKLAIPKLSPKLMIIVGGALVLLVAAGGGAYVFLGGHGKEEAAATAAAQVKPPTFLDLPDVLVNLSSSAASDRTQYLKVKVTLELPDQAMSAQIQPVMPRLMDAFQTYLRELRPTDLEGSAGLYRLKEELTRRVNASIAPNRVTAVLFKEIVIQ